MMVTEQGFMKGFLGRLRRDNRGNTLALVAAGIFPMAGMVGGAIDISRLYLTRTRVQQACDAGALAGRKSMTGLTWATANETTAKQFFNMNFLDHRYGTGAKTITYTASTAGAVSGHATVTVPMTLMSLFHIPDKTITVDCKADLQLPNTDVMFVLDTTLSMNDTNVGDSESRIAVLRKAVKNFYDELEKVKAAGSNIRYGFVPYSSTVNVGMLLKRDWVVDNWTYDSRIPDGTSTADGGTAAATVSKTTTATKSGSYTSETYNGPAEKCTAPANSGYSDTSTYSAWDPSATAVPRSQIRTRTRKGITYGATLKNGVCTITKTTFNDFVETLTTTITANPNAGNENADSTYYHWIYKPVSYSMDTLKGTGSGDATMTGGFFNATVENNHKIRKISWTVTNACIEERSTRRTNEGTNIPRYDMDVDVIPDKTKPETQWRPYLPGVVFGRKNTSFTATSGWSYTGDAETATRTVNINATTNYLTPNSSPFEYGACPTYSRKMGTIDGTTLTNYLTGLVPAGYTYHDIGFLWGLRLLSRDGLFATENRAAETTGKVSRNLIFMTDGDTDTRIGSYDAWGLSAVDRRRTPITAIPTNAAQNTITETRLLELCAKAKDEKGITVWVIAFGTAKTATLISCASQGKDYEAKNAAELASTFSKIVSQIAQLRIIQ